MRTPPGFSRIGIAFLALVLCAAAAPLPAASRSGNDLLSLVPADAASVAVIRLSDLRESPLAGKLFSGADHMTAEGDAARFLEEAQLDPKKDVDTVVIAGTASGGKHGSPTLALFEGRFDPERLAAAAWGRGAVRRSTSAGDYFLLPEKHGHDEEHPGAAAFVSSSLVIAGTESAVMQALADRQSGGTGFVSGAGLGRELKRVDRGASVWALVDVARYPSVAHRGAHVHVSGDVNGEPAMAIMGAMKSVSLVAIQAKARGDSLELSATGLSSDAETRQLLEDSLRGLMAMWRLAVQDKSPELVSVLRKFSVSSDSEAVSIHGTLTGSALRTLSQKKHHSDD
jgi:hypothetical protein